MMKNSMNLVNWAENKNYFLEFEAKDRSRFHLALWCSDYNPELCLVLLSQNKNQVIYSHSCAEDAVGYL